MKIKIGDFVYNSSVRDPSPVKVEGWELPIGWYKVLQIWDRYDGSAPRLALEGAAKAIPNYGIDSDSYPQFVITRFTKVKPKGFIALNPKNSPCINEPSAEELLAQGYCPCGSGDYDGCSVSGCPLYLYKEKI